MANNWILTSPLNHTLYSSHPSEIRNVKELVVSGMHRFFRQATAPTARFDGTAFDSDDLGSIWIDSDDNKISILTATTPTWTEISVELFAAFLAAAREIAFADATLTLKNTDAEDTGGGRQSRFIVKGIQSGDEETTLGYIEFSHDGTADDQKGQIRFVINDGNDNDAPSKEALRIQATGKIDVANSLAVLDEDDMASDDAECVPTQQSVKAFGTMVPAVSGAGAGYAGEESITLANGFILKQGTETRTGVNTDITFGAAFPTAISNAWGCAGNDEDSYIAIHTLTTTTMKARVSDASVTTIRWFAIGY